MEPMGSTYLYYWEFLTITRFVGSWVYSVYLPEGLSIGDSILTDTTS